MTILNSDSVETIAASLAQDRAALRAFAANREYWPRFVNEAVSDALKMFDDQGGCSSDIAVAFLLAAAEEGEHHA